MNKSFFFSMNQSILHGLWNDVATHILSTITEGYDLWPLRLVCKAWYKAIRPSWIQSFMTRPLTSLPDAVLIHMTNVKVLSMYYYEEESKPVLGENGEIYNVFCCECCGVLPTMLSHFEALEILIIQFGTLIITDDICSDFMKPIATMKQLKELDITFSNRSCSSYEFTKITTEFYFAINKLDQSIALTMHYEICN